MNKIKKVVPYAIVWLVPMLVAAQGLSETIEDIKELLNNIIPLLMLIATIVFLWGIITYITAAGDEEKIKKGRQYVIWGLLGLFVMVAVWGLVGILEETFGVSGDTDIPRGPTQSN